MSKPFATIDPLEGKYYGTIVVAGNATINIWGNRIGNPSTRELLKNGVDRSDKAEVAEIMSDGHYEDEGDYLIALKIVTALNDSTTQDDAK